MISIVDTHCHLDLDAFDVDRLDVIQRALSANVHALMLIGYNPDRWKSTACLCAAYPFMRRAVGIHPNDASSWNAQVERDLRKEIERTSPLAIGEIGLDFYRSSDNVDEQVHTFDRQMQIAREHGLPVIIHQRAAEEQVLAVLERYEPVRGVMHCFTGDTGFAKRCTHIGMHLGIGGVVTFPKSQHLRAGLAHVPQDRLLLETDAPFLAPQAQRGKRNEPVFLENVVDTLAEVMSTSTAATVRTTTENAIELFGPSLADAVRSGTEQS